MPSSNLSLYTSVQPSHVFKRNLSNYSLKHNRISYTVVNFSMSNDFNSVHLIKWVKHNICLSCPSIHLYHSAAILESVGNKGFVFALSLPVQPHTE